MRYFLYKNVLLFFMKIFVNVRKELNDNKENDLNNNEV